MGSAYHHLEVLCIGIPAANSTSPQHVTVKYLHPVSQGEIVSVKAGWVAVSSIGPAVAQASPAQWATVPVQGVVQRSGQEVGRLLQLNESESAVSQAVWLTPGVVASGLREGRSAGGSTGLAGALGPQIAGTHLDPNGSLVVDVALAALSQCDDRQDHFKPHSTQVGQLPALEGKWRPLSLPPGSSGIIPEFVDISGQLEWKTQASDDNLLDGVEATTSTITGPS